MITIIFYITILVCKLSDRSPVITEIYYKPLKDKDLNLAQNIFLNERNSKKLPDITVYPNFNDYQSNSKKFYTQKKNDPFVNKRNMSYAEKETTNEVDQNHGINNQQKSGNIEGLYKKNFNKQTIIDLNQSSIESNNKQNITNANNDQSYNNTENLNNSKNDNSEPVCYILMLNDENNKPDINLTKISKNIYKLCTSQDIKQLYIHPLIKYIEPDNTYRGQSYQFIPPVHFISMMNYTNSILTNSFFESTMMVYLPFKYIYNFFFSFYKYEYSGKGVDIYLVDSKVNEKHPDLKKRVFNFFVNENTDELELKNKNMEQTKEQKLKNSRINNINETKYTEQSYDQKANYNEINNYNELKDMEQFDEKNLDCSEINHFNQKIYTDQFDKMNADLCIPNNYNITFETNAENNLQGNSLKNSNLVDDSNFQDLQISDYKYCKNHGSTVATTIAGTRTGFAKKSKVFVLNILDCDNKTKLSKLIKALSYLKKRNNTSILHLPISGPKSEILNHFVDQLASKNFIIVTSAGNNSDLACNYSPGSAKNVINIGSLNSLANISTFSNFGGCIRIYSLGENIVSDAGSNKKYLQGTSYSSALVAGAIAVFLEKEPNSSLDKVWKFLVANSKMSSGSFLIQKIPKNISHQISNGFYIGEIGWFGFYIVIFYLFLFSFLIYIIIRYIKRRRKDRLRF
ncbi:hypothetical protein GVAV_002912 [Gurleya vavrai]